MTKINYQLMNESNIVANRKHRDWEGKWDGDYLPNYDELIKNSSCKEEIEKWAKLKEMNFTFAFELVYSQKMACGHWEIFQSPSIYSVDELVKENSNRKCTRCICGW